MKKIELKNIFSRNKTVTFKKVRFSPNRSWGLMKKFFSLIFILIVGFGIFMFIAVDRGFIRKDDQNIESFTTEINFSDIEKINKIIEKKNINFEYFKSPNIEVVDPYQN